MNRMRSIFLMFVLSWSLSPAFSAENSGEKDPPSGKNQVFVDDVKELSPMQLSTKKDKSIVCSSKNNPFPYSSKGQTPRVPDFHFIGLLIASNETVRRVARND